MRSNILKKWFKISFFLFLFCLGLSCGMELRDKINNSNKEVEFVNISTNYTKEVRISICEEDDSNNIDSIQSSGNVISNEEPMKSEIIVREVDFEALTKEKNKDVCAWIYIPDTLIDYPVLRHQTDDNYYLDYNLDGSKGYPGCIYMQTMNSPRFTDKYTVLYGHNMKNGSMFGNLHKFEDEEFFNSHPYFYIYTPESTLVYEIFGAYEYSNVHLLLGIDTSTDENFQAYLDSILLLQGASIHTRPDTEIDAQTDSIVTLSTCIGGHPEKRYLVTGKLAHIY